MKKGFLISCVASIVVLSAVSVVARTKLNPHSVLIYGVNKELGKFNNLPDSVADIHKKAIRFAPRTNESGIMEVLITFTREVDEEELMSIGLADAVIIGDVAICTISLTDLDNLEDCSLIKSISIPGIPRLNCDYARRDTGVDVIRYSGEGLPRKYDGEGVTVALFDQGIETTHINFLTPDRKESRIKGLWNYTVEYQPSGQNNYIEDYYSSPEEINEFRTDDGNQTHGTHTLGIMAGSFGVNKEDPEHDYSGMAPASDILIGCGSLAYSNVLKAIKHFINYSKENDTPLVVNLSFGDNIGPHDGTDPFPKALNKLAEEVPVCMSSGNEGLKKIVINKVFSDKDNNVKTVISPTSMIRNQLGVSWEAACEVQVWSEDNTPFTIETGFWNKENSEWLYKLPVAPDGYASYIANGVYESLSNEVNDDFDYLYEDSAIGISTGLDPNNNRYTADIWYLLKKQLNHIDRNIVPALIITGEPGKRVDVYVDGDYNEFTSGKISGWTEGNSDGSISNIACGINTIAIGSYCTRPLTDSSIEGEVSDFTSWGVLYDGRVLPDILAPGDCIASSMSTPFTESDYYSESINPAVYGVMYGEDNPFYWTALQGTSQSSPAVAGIIALWLQANPYLTPAEIKDILKETANPTSEMTFQCGSGKVNALEGLKKVIQDSSVSNLNFDKNQNLLFMVSKDLCTVQEVNKESFVVTVYDVTGKISGHFTSDNGEDIVFNLKDFCSPGVYVISARSTSSYDSIKVVVNS